MMVNSVAIIGDLFLTWLNAVNIRGLLMAMFGVADHCRAAFGCRITGSIHGVVILYQHPARCHSYSCTDCHHAKIVHNTKGRSIDYLGAFLLCYSDLFPCCWHLCGQADSMHGVHGRLLRFSAHRYWLLLPLPLQSAKPGNR